MKAVKKERHNLANLADDEILELMGVTPETVFIMRPVLRQDLLVRRIFWLSVKFPGAGMNSADCEPSPCEKGEIPRSRDELTQFTGKSRYYTMSAIVAPLLEQGRLKMTLPDKAKSSKQRYVRA